MENKYSNRYLIKTGQGLQKVDGLNNSQYFIELSEKYSNNEITSEELSKLITQYYEDKKDYSEKEKEADVVSKNISEILKDDNFILSPGTLFSIHKKLFGTIFSNAGFIRNKNFKKNEWVLNGDSVNYCNYDEIDLTLTYDFNEQKKVDFSTLSKEDMIQNIANFISNVWQIHPFEEGNTRTVAVFLIKYLRYLGFDVTNDIFENNSWYFRNALVRANYSNISNGIFEDKSYLIKFLKNLMFKGTFELRNRDLNIYCDVFNNSKLSENEKNVLKQMIANNQVKTDYLVKTLNLSVRTIRSIISSLKKKNIIKRVNGNKLGFWDVKININK